MLEAQHILDWQVFQSIRVIKVLNFALERKWIKSKTSLKSENKKTAILSPMIQFSLGTDQTSH